MHALPVALTIAGSDPSGGAGLQADLKTFHQRRVYGMSVVTLLTVQNTQSVKNVFVLEPEKVIQQLDFVLSDLPCHAAKTGALGNGKVLSAVAQRAKDFKFPLVVDPVMVSQNGQLLFEKSALKAFRKELLPYAALVTPNLYEAEALAGFPVRDLSSMEKAARELSKDGVQAVLVKGGHLEGEAIDLLLFDNRIELFRAQRVQTQHSHGTGCTFSAVITAELAKGQSLKGAVQIAKAFITKALASSPGLGRGAGPLNHHVEV